MHHQLSSKLFFLFIVFTAEALAYGQDDTGAALWRYYPPIGPSKVSANSPNQVSRSVRNSYPAMDSSMDVQSRNEYQPAEEEPYSGFSSHLDPLFDTAARPSWKPPELAKPVFDRPSFDYPNYNAPLYRIEPIRRPVAERPEYDKPNDDKPNNSMRYVEAPAEIAPTLATPAYQGPNYNFEPYLPPADKAPGYDRTQIQYARPEYQAPVYQPEEYRPPREVPPEYMAPPRE